MKRILLVALALVALSFGCASKQDSLVGPSPSTVQTAGAFQTQVDGVLVWAVHDRTAPNGVKVLYICDYPVGYYGPPAPGHCYTDGTGCTGPELTQPGIVYAAPSFQGDPTADDLNAADGDGSVVK